MTLALLLLGLGLAFIVAEVLFPSFGVLSLLAVASIIASVARAFAIDSSIGIQFSVAAAILVPSTVLFGFKVLPHTPLGKRFIARGLSFESSPATDERDVGLEGRSGTVEAVLRPSGIARIDGRRVDVVSRGEVIEVGTPVRVIDVQGNRVVVAAVERSEAAHEEEKS